MHISYKPLWHTLVLLSENHTMFCLLPGKHLALISYQQACGDTR